MSKRLQVLLPDEEYARLRRASQRLKKTVAEWVRESIRAGLDLETPSSPEKRIAKVLTYAKHSGPTGEIEDLLAQIEQGRNS